MQQISFQRRLISGFLAAVSLIMLTGCSPRNGEMEAEEASINQTEMQAEEPTIMMDEETLPAGSGSQQVEMPRELAEDTLVRVVDYIPGIRQELPYATENNFTGQRIYDFTDAYLRYGTVKKLEKVCEELAQQGLRLKIWDGFRPVAAQFRLWEVCPDPDYVANPNTHFSSHSRGNTVDVTLVDENGKELEMPTGFDDFSGLADRDYSDCTETAAANARMLQDLMEKYGFSGYFEEWWHYADTQSYPVEESFEPKSMSRWYADCQEFIGLRTEPDTAAEVITRIPAKEEFWVLATDGDFALISYQGKQGYVLRSYIQPVEESAESLWAANCEAYISLRKAPGSKEVLARIPAGGTFRLLQWDGLYAKVFYEGQPGYVLSSYMMPQDRDYFSRRLATVVPTAVYSYEQMAADMETLKAAYPGTVSLGSIGVSEQGRDIPVLRMGDPDAGHHILLQGAIHGREHMTAWLLMAMAEDWLNSGGEDLEGVCCHIIPMSNPDGVAVSQNGMLEDDQIPIYRRDRELGYTTLEAPRYAQRWKANGLGTDLNRNFPSGWEQVSGPEGPSAQRYRGEAPFSAAEARALRDYTLQYAFSATISYHATGSVIYYEYGAKQPVKETSRSLALAVKDVTGYGLEGSSGVDGAGYKDWAMDALEIPSLTIEIGCQDAPLTARELYSVFARNCGVLPAVARWLQL